MTGAGPRAATPRDPLDARPGRGPHEPQPGRRVLPALIAPPGYLTGCIFTPQTGTLPVVSVPGDGGGMAWNLISFDPETKLIYTSYSVVATVRGQMEGNVGFRPEGEKRSGPAPPKRNSRWGQADRVCKHSWRPQEVQRQPN